MPNIITGAFDSVAEGVADTDLYKYLKKSYVDEDISDYFKGFYDYFYSKGYDFDIGGFSLIFFYPPHLSGLKGNKIGLPPPDLLRDRFRDFISVSLEFTSVDIEVEKTSIGIIGNETFDYATHVRSAGEISVSYLNNNDLSLYEFHSMWVRYIHAVILGHIKPQQDYIDDNLIDYMGSIYFLKFDADMKSPKMIAKALGIYPNSVPYKELVGVRGQHPVTISNCSYTCSYFYEEPIYSDSRYDDPIKPDPNAPVQGYYLWNEFLKLFGPLYERS